MAYKNLLVTFTVDETGKAPYPDFNSLQIIKDSLIEPPTPGTPKWARYFDVYSAGNVTWHVDTISPINMADDDSPWGSVRKMVIIPAAFADEAVEKFSDQCKILDDTLAKAFYEDRAHINDPDEEMDVEIMQAIRLKQELGKELTANQVNMIDATNDKKGIRENKLKTWAGFKTKFGI